MQAGISLSGRRSMLKLAQRMVDNFCSGVSTSKVRDWEMLHVGNIGQDVRVMTRNTLNNTSEPPGILLSASTSVWMPISHEVLFNFLRNEQVRSEWDILSRGEPMQEMVHIAKGQSHENCVSFLRTNVSNLLNTHFHQCRHFEVSKEKKSGFLLRFVKKQLTQHSSYFELSLLRSSWI